eukprot:CAMPEP_0179864642 /NCGR_PEP_ID=MMETSP0982-20121206/16300_1 /TAXON_ID=483367 /ORGANISM="non described non described, Strain CCMP 2436" /LENGTH=48 /DNA_ID= /DNA_START= /DNA_END= /DNA_ORIENTATION=
METSCCAFRQSPWHLILHSASCAVAWQLPSSDACLYHRMASGRRPAIS